jgi:hypothetical protein
MREANRLIERARRSPRSCGPALLLFSVLPLLAVGRAGADDFVFPAPESAVYDEFVVSAGGTLEVEVGTQITGDLHSNGTVDLRSGSTVTGNVSAVGPITGDGTVTGTKTAGAAAVPLPAPFDEATARGLANRVIEGNATFDDDQVIDDVLFVHGDVRFRGSVNGTGTVIASGSIIFDNVTNGHPVVLDPASRMSFSAVLDISIGKVHPLRGVLVAGRDLVADKELDITGVIVAGRNVRVHPDSRLVKLVLDRFPPEVAITSPTDGAFVNTPLLRVTGTVTDDGVLAEVTVNDFPATVAGGVFTADVPIAEGVNAITVRAVDAMGNESFATATVSLDSVAPALTILEPVAGRFVSSVPPEVALAYTDGGSGVDSTTFRISLGPVVPSCEVGPSEALCQLPLLASGDYVVEVEIRDGVGNLASASRAFQLVVDREVPVVSIAEPTEGSYTRTATVRVSGTVSDDSGSLASLLVAGREVAPVPGPFSAEVTLQEGEADLLVVATDETGKQGSARVRVVVDTTPPTLVVEVPVTGQTTNQPSTPVSGRADDVNGISRVEVGGASVPLADNRFDAEVPLEEGSNEVTVRAVDTAGNSGDAALVVRRLTPPSVLISSPADLSYLAATTTDVLGTVSDPAATVTVNGLPAEVSGNQFIVRGLPLIEGGTVITATATSAAGLASSDTIGVVRDLTAPHVAVSYPRNDAVLFTPLVTVYGLVNDIVPGTVNASEATVTVNGQPAAVANRSFLAQDVPLVAGDNVLTVEATDESGNIGRAEVSVRRLEPALPRIEVVGGAGQQGVIGSALSQPLEVVVRDGAGLPVAGTQVLFKVVGSNGTLDGGRRQVAVATGADGRALVHFTLGTRAGVASQVVEALASGYVGPAVFTETALAGEPALLVVDSGSQQIGTAGHALPRPLVAVVTDSGFNRLEGVPVVFHVARGRGQLENGQQELRVLTDSDGRAITRFIIAPEEGIANNVAVARIEALPDGPAATFVATAWAAGDSALTSVSGVVLDNMNLPIAGVTIRIRDTSLLTHTDSQGTFRIDHAPVGTVKLIVDGSTAARPGSWPDLEFVLTTVSGRDSTLGMPIYLLPLDLGTGILVDETRGGVLTLPEMPGFKLEVNAGSVTFPNGSRSGVVSVTVVHSDKVPMVPNFGQQPRFIVTIQPAGARFDPPARLTLPNLEGLAPGEVTEFYSFDHDLGHFVSIGPATVSEDGSVIASNRGVGILKAGWHCGGNPPSSGGTPHNCPECQRCDGSNCVPDSGQDGNRCQNDHCKECKGGSCTQTSTRVEIDEPPDNPSPSDSLFATNFSFLSATVITANASLTGNGDPSEIEWTVTPTLGGVRNESPADRKGPTFSFTPDPPPHPPYVPGTGCGNPGNGSCARSQPLSYAILAKYCGSNDTNTISQDQLDIIRQEYLNHSIAIPDRDEFRVPAATANFSAADVLTTAYSVVLGSPETLAQNVRDELNRRIRDDVQAIAVGTTNLAPTAPVVTPGQNVQEIGAILNTQRCNGAPQPATCDDQVLNDAIVAGPNGIAETVAENRATNVGLRINSAWRNPERNEAVGGVLNSRHQYGNAIDLDILGPAEGLTTAQLFCILQTAADATGANGFAEHFGTQRACNAADVTHVHVQQ